MLRRLTILALLSLLVVGAVACRPAIIVRVQTLTYHDGSLDRRVEIVGRTSDGETPAEDDWLEERAGIRLAEPDAWGRVERGPGWLVAEGFFASAEELPALLSMESESTVRPARTRTLFDVEDRVVLKRWTYVERHGDPFSASDSATALAAIVELAVEALTSELDDHFGSAVDPAPAQRLLRNEGRALAQALLTVTRSAPGPQRAQERAELRTQLLSQYGVPAATTGDPDDYWDVQMPVILAWSREQVAAALTTPQAPIEPEELTFWPLGDDHEQQLTEIVGRVWGSDEAFLAELEPHLAALVGYYGGDDAPRFRFESRVRLPGTLFATNGMPDGNTAAWLFREQDLTFGEVSLRAQSVELQEEALVALGARREFDAPALVRLADLLWKRDREGALVEVLSRAVAEGNLEILRDESAVADELVRFAAELADLLDPAVPRDGSDAER